LIHRFKNAKTKKKREKEGTKQDKCSSKVANPIGPALFNLHNLLGRIYYLIAMFRGLNPIVSYAKWAQLKALAYGVA